MAVLDELKPCPFCGLKASLGKCPGKGKSYYVICRNKKCQIKPSTSVHNKEEVVVVMWNTRQEVG